MFGKLQDLSKSEMFRREANGGRKGINYNSWGVGLDSGIELG